MKRGYIVVLDAIIALALVLIVFTAIFGIHYSISKTGTTSFRNLHYLSEDLLDVMNKQGILNQIGSDWAEANGSATSEYWINASNTSRAYLEVLVPKNIGYRLTIDDEIIAENLSRVYEGSSASKTHSSRLVVGYGKGLPTLGRVARAFLTNIKEKNTASYVYFGGFEGQGNLTKLLTLPDSLDSIHSAYIEVDSGKDFELEINGNPAGTFAAGPEDMNANIKSLIAGPETYFNKGVNKIELKFINSNLSERYIGGGFIKVDYNTSKMDTYNDSTTSFYQFPGINGFINLYSSFFVPGDLKKMDIYLHYSNDNPFVEDYPTYLALNDITVFSSNMSGEVKTTISDDYIRENITDLNYNDLSNKMTLLRMANENLSLEQGVADVVLITDVSTSMLSCMDPAEENLSIEELLWIEAENADTITSPMQVITDNTASGGRHVRAPEGSGAGGYAEYKFNLLRGGDFAIIGRVSGNSTSSDSFSLSIDGGASTNWNIPILAEGNWNWSYAVTNTFDVGNHTLRISNVEDGSRIDKILLTNNLSYTPRWKGGNNLTCSGCPELGRCRNIDKGEYGFAYDNISLEDFSTGATSCNRPLIIYDEQDPRTFGGGWGWNGWQACCRDGSTSYNGAYSYRVNGGSEAWTSPLPDATNANYFTFAYKKNDSNAYFSVYWYTNGYWHEVTDTNTHSYQGWSIPHYTDTNWHLVVINLSNETQGTGSDPDVSPKGVISNFEYGPGESDVIWFDYTFFSFAPAPTPTPVGYCDPADISQCCDARCEGVVTNIGWCNITNATDCCNAFCEGPRNIVSWCNVSNVTACCTNTSCDPTTRTQVAFCNVLTERCCTGNCGAMSDYMRDYINNVPESGLVGWWKFDGDVLDSSGYGNDGTRYGFTDGWVAGKFGSALQFDGVDDYVSVPDSASLDIADAITIEAWMNSFAIGGWTKKKPITISGSASDLIDYQVNLTIPYDPDMQPDFDDLRFYDNTGNPLNYWLEDYTASTNAKVWVKLPSIPTSGTTIYMYYGNPSVADAGSESATLYISNRRFDFTPSGRNWTCATAGPGACNAAFNGDFYSSPNSGWVYETARGCERAHLQQTITLPDTSPLYLHYWRKEYHNTWGGPTGIKINATSTDWSSGTILHTWGGSGTGASTSPWEEFWDDISAFKGKTVLLEIFYHDDGDNDPSWCFMGDHGAWLRVDDLSITTMNSNPSPKPTATLGSETNLETYIIKKSSYGINISAGSVYASINSQKISTSMPSGWNHIILTYDRNAGGTDEMKLFINGAIKKTEDYSNAISINSNDLIMAISGIFDEVRIYNRALKPEEIYAHWTAGPVCAPSTVACCEKADLTYYTTRSDYDANCEDVPGGMGRPCSLTCPNGCSGDCKNPAYLSCAFDWSGPYIVDDCSSVDADRCDEVEIAPEVYERRAYNMTNYRTKRTYYRNGTISAYYNASDVFRQNNYNYYQQTWNYYTYPFESEYEGKYICRSRFSGNSIGLPWFSANLSGSGPTIYSDWRYGDECDYCQQFYRKNFTVSDKTTVKNLTLYTRNDDGVICYINGARIIQDLRCQGDYDWNNGINVTNPSMLVDGNNVLACSVKDGGSGEGFDAKLVANDTLTLLNSRSTWSYYPQKEFCGKGCDPITNCEYGHYADTCAGYTNIDLIANGDMEVDTNWIYSENNATWSGGYSTSDAYYGLYSYTISYPGSTPSNIGDYAAITQEIPGSAAAILTGCVKDSYTGASAGYHLKQVLIDDAVVWEDDVEGDEGGWLCFAVNITSELAGKTAANLTLMVYDNKTFSNFGVSVYWDNIRTIVPWYTGPSPAYICPSDYCMQLGDGDYCDVCNIVKLKLAKYLDRDFTNLVLKGGVSVGNRVALVSYGSETYNTTELTSNLSFLNATIAAYDAMGQTCISCAIQDSMEILNETDPLRYRAMVVMSDGDANCLINGTCMALDRWELAANESINKSCEAFNKYNITVHAVGFGTGAGIETLKKIAECGNGTFAASNDPDVLKKIYRDIAEKILNSSYEKQIAFINAELRPAILYPDSNIRFEYDKIPLGIPEYGRISITMDTDRFNDIENCSKKIDVIKDINVAEAMVTSYSSAYWTDYSNVTDINGIPYEFYSLRDGHLGSGYIKLGDPFIVQIPREYILPGGNTTISVRTGSRPANDTNCSPDNRIIYTIMMKSMGSYGGVFSTMVGCNWTIQFEDNSNITAPVPDNYNGTARCLYTGNNVSYYNDAVNDAVYRLLNGLDYNMNNKTDVKFDPDMIKFESSKSGGIRSLWGPIVIKLILWM